MFKHFKKWVISSGVVTPAGGVPTKFSHLYHDFVRGVSTVRLLISNAPEQAFLQIERIRYQHRLARIDNRLFDAYRRLGEALISFQAERVLGTEEAIIDGVPILVADTDLSLESMPPGCEEIERCYQQIEIVLEDRKRVLSEIEEVVRVTTSEDITTSGEKGDF